MERRSPMEFTKDTKVVEILRERGDIAEVIETFE
jgi:hypothetical protein